MSISTSIDLAATSLPIAHSLPKDTQDTTQRLCHVEDQTQGT
jgi:hypothetical protein